MCHYIVKTHMWRTLGKGIIFVTNNCNKINQLETSGWSHVTLAYCEVEVKWRI